MNKSIGLTIITMLSIVMGSCFVSCDNELRYVEPAPTGQLELVSSDLDRRYIDSEEDSIIISSSHDLLFEAKYNYSIDWDRVLTTLSTCDDYKLYERWSFEYHQQWETVEEIKAFDGDSVEADWIKVEMIKDAPLKMKISIKENKTDKQRAARFMMYAYDKTVQIEGRFVIVQMPYDNAALEE